MKNPVILSLTLSGAKGKGKDLKMRNLRSFAVFAAQDDTMTCYNYLNCGNRRGRPDG